MSTEDRLNPYIGPRTFEQKDAELFFGREREAKALLTLVASQRLVLFYAQSGAGKSSLINIRLIPGLQGRGFTVWPVGRVSGELIPDLQVSNLFVFNLLLKLDEGQHNSAAFNTTSLGDYLLAHPPTNTAGVDVATARGRVLIIDQFEEVLTNHRDRWQDREGFFLQLEEAMQADPLLWIVLILREDYVAPLDVYAPLLTNRLRTRFYMQRLDSSAALEAITKPAEKAGRPFASGVAQQLVDNLRQLSKVEKQETSGRLTLGEFVEPVQLQVVCQRLWANLQNRPGDSITAEDVAELGDVNTALADFYEQAIRQTEQETGVNRYQLRNWVDKELITEGGTRGTVARGTTASGGLPNAAADSLSRQFLLRQEPRAAGIWYELIHERFIEPIQQSNQRWRESQSPLYQTAIEWERSGRKREKLYQGDLLQESLNNEIWDALPITVKDFLTSSQDAQSQRDLETERQKATAEALTARILRWLTTALVVAVLVAAILAILAFSESIRATARANDAASAQGEAIMARDTAESGASDLATSEADARIVAQQAEFARVTAESLAGVAATAQVDAQNAEATAVADRDESERLARLALSRELAAAAVDNLNTDANLCSLLALQAVYSTYSVDNTVTSEAKNAIQQCLQGTPLQLTISVSQMGVNAVTFSPDGSQLATGGQDEIIRIWNATSGDLIKELPQVHIAPITNLTFSPDGTRLASSSEDNTVLIWQLNEDVRQLNEDASIQKICEHIDGSNTILFRGHTNSVNDVAFSSDSSLMATASGDGTVRVWEVDTCAPLVDFNTRAGLVNSVSFSPDGTRLLTANSDGTARVWDSNTGIELLTLSGHSATVADAEYSADGNLIATGSFDRTAIIWYANTGQERITLIGHTGSINSVAFDPDGLRLVTASSDTTARMWDVASGQGLAVFASHNKAVKDAVFNPQGNTVVTVSEDKTAKVWSSVQQYTFAGSQIALNTDGTLLATASVNGVIRVWNVEFSELIITFEDTSRQITDITFSPDSTTLGVAYEDGNTALWDVSSGQRRLIPDRIHAFAVNAVAFSPDGNLLASGSEDWTVKLANTATGQSLFDSVDYENEIEYGGSINDIVFSPLNDIFVTVSNDGRLVGWDISSNKVLFAVQSQPSKSIYAVAFSPDGKHLAFGDSGGTITIWDIETQQELLVFQAHSSSIFSVTYSPDGTWLAIGGSDSIVSIWDIVSGDQILNLSTHGDAVNDVIFTPDRRKLIVASANGITRIVLLDIDELIALMQDNLTRDWTLEECKRFLHQDECPVLNP